MLQVQTTRRSPDHHGSVFVPLGFIVLIVLTLSLIGCGSGSSTTTAVAPASTAPSADGSATTTAPSAATTAVTVAPKTVDLAYVYATSIGIAMVEMAKGAKAAGDSSPGVNLTMAAPGPIDGPKQVQLFQAATKTSTDGIVLEALQPDLFARPVQETTGAKIPVVAVDAPVPGTTLLISQSNYEVGKIVAEALLEKIPADAKGEVVIGDDIPGLSVLQARIQGFTEVLKKNRPGVTIAGPYEVFGLPTENFNAWNNIVKAHPNALAYFGDGGFDTTTLADIQRQSGKKFLAVGVDYTDKSLQAVKDGYVLAIGSPEHWLKAYIATKLMIDHAQNGTPLPEGYWDTGSLLINQGNIDDIIARQKDDATRFEWFRAAAESQLADPSKYLAPLSSVN